MSDTLYLMLEQNVEVRHPHIYLQDIAKLSCSNPKILNRLRVLPVLNLEPHKPGRYVVSSMELIRQIQQKEPDLTISHIGEPTFIITYQNEVDVGGLFSQIYTLVTGNVSSGFTILEISYSVGIGLGVLFFFNHFGKWKITEDPTPMEVEMRAYEEQVDQTILEMESRKENNSG